MRCLILLCILISIGYVYTAHASVDCEVVGVVAEQAMRSKQDREPVVINGNARIYSLMRKNINGWPVHFKAKWRAKKVKQFRDMWIATCKRGNY